MINKELLFGVAILAALTAATFAAKAPVAGASIQNTSGIAVSPCEPNLSLRSCSIGLSATKSGIKVTVNAGVSVINSRGTPIGGATVAVTWKLPNGTTKSQTATTTGSGIAVFSISGTTGTFKLTVVNITKMGYSFDASQSILVKSITK